MKKRIISIMILLVLLINLMPMSLVNATDEKVTVTVVADKTSAKQGNVINYTITCSATENLSSIQLELDIPTGLTYIANSGKIASNLKSVIGDVTEASYTETEKLILISHYLPFTLTGDVTIATFQCKVDNNASGDYEVGLKNIEFTDKNIDIIADSDYKAVTAKTTVVIPVTGVTLNKSTTTINAGATETLIATVAPTTATNKTLTWESSNNTFATVDNTGVVTGVKPGNATITVKTVDGSFSATCNVTIICAHTNTTTHEAVGSTCEVQGNAEYVTCNDCGKVITGSDEKLALADHNYGTLISQVDAVHTATELKDGTKAHYKCSVCNKLFDESKKEVTAEKLVIKAPSHTYGDWEADTTNHWKECGCGNIISQGAHKGGTATCKNKAVCKVCGAPYGSTNPDNHGDTEVRDAVEAKCEIDGYTGDTYCKDCNTKIITGTKIDRTGHKGGTATCKNKAVCTECQNEYGTIDSKNHVNTEVKDAQEATCETDGYTGDTYCKDCNTKIITGTKIDKTGHKGGTATCKTKAVCTECQNEYGTIDSKNHVNTEVRDAVEATYETEGYTGDVYCKDCNTLIEKGTVIPVKEKIVESKPETNLDPTKPQTDDNSNIMLWVSLLVISGICFVVISKWNTKRTIGKHSK